MYAVSKAREDAELKSTNRYHGKERERAIRTVLACKVAAPHRLIVEKNTQEGKDLVQALLDPSFVGQVVQACADGWFVDSLQGCNDSFCS